MALNQTLWFLVGSALCAIELFVPLAFVPFVLGLSALVIGLLFPWIPYPGLQVLLWMGIAAGLFAASRRLVARSQGSFKLEATHAETLTAILPGQTGRVLYEGNSWPAQCEDVQQTIAPQQKVYIVRRVGNTLIVLPESLLQADLS